MADVFDPVCCPCLIRNQLEWVYNTRQGQCAEAGEVESLMEGLVGLVGWAQFGAENTGCHVGEG